MRKDVRKSSNKSKVVSALAMLLVSAVALSSASYAWFTMSKTAQVEGIKLEATADDNLEISLGSTADGDTVTAPSATEYFASLVTFSETIGAGQGGYYLGKLKPVSSENGINFWYLNGVGESVINGGNSYVVPTFSETYFTTTSTKATKDTTEDDVTDGYYIDIPVWLRTNADGKTPIYLDAASITDTVTGSKLADATRIQILSSAGAAITQTAGDTNLSGSTIALAAASTSTTNVVKSDNSAFVNDNYNTITATTITSNSGNSIYDLSKDVLCGSTSGTAGDNVLQITVRMWFEGQDTTCNIANVAAVPSVSLHFTTDHTTGA